MSSYSAEFVSGSIVFRPRRPTEGKHPVLLLHGMNGDARSWNTYSNWRTGLYTRRLAAANFSIMSVSLGNGFGAATESTDMEVMRAWSVTNMPWCDSSKMVLLGMSMGHFNAWGYRRDNPTRVAGILGVMGSGDLEDVRTRDPVVGSRAAIDAAWGVTYPTALPAPGLFPAQANTLKGIPFKMYYSSADTVIPSAKVLEWVAAVEGTSAVAGAGAHGDAIMADVPVQGSVDFLRSCGA